MKRYILTTIIAIAAVTTLSAQESRTQALINASLRNWEIELRAGYNIGGVSPLPLPEEIRSLDSFNPTVFRNSALQFRANNRPHDIIAAIYP